MLGSESNCNRETILVVDDAEAVRKVVCATLLQSGYRCLEAEDGKDALERLAGECVHLVLTDIIMPRMGGAELAGHVVRRWPELRIIFMSGYPDDPVVRSMQVSPALLLPKPFTAGALTAKIRQVLDAPWAGAVDT
jgi:two-component system cell cycle sensor histidine kinase/response regulator CckA